MSSALNPVFCPASLYLRCTHNMGCANSGSVWHLRIIVARRSAVHRWPQGLARQRALCVRSPLLSFSIQAHFDFLRRQRVGAAHEHRLPCVARVVLIAF